MSAMWDKNPTVEFFNSNLHLVSLTYLQLATSIHLTRNSSHPNISMHILHAVLYTFLKVLMRRICLKNQQPLQLVIVSVILVTLMFDSGVIL